MSKEKGITLVALVVTIIVLIILAGISINLLLGDNGIITKAQEAKKQQKIAEVKEKLSLELVAAETDAIIRNESLEEEQLNDIVSKYGTLKDDKDTILTKDYNYEISLKEIWYGALSTSGSYTDKKKQIEMLEKDIKELQEKYDELEKVNSGNSTILADLRTQINQLEDKNKSTEEKLKTEQEKNAKLETQIAEGKEFKSAVAKAITDEGVETEQNAETETITQNIGKILQSRTANATATEDSISEGKSAWINGKLVIGKGTDSKSSYQTGYNDGYSKGEADTSSTVGNISVSFALISELSYYENQWYHKKSQETVNMEIVNGKLISCNYPTPSMYVSAKSATASISEVTVTSN